MYGECTGNVRGMYKTEREFIRFLKQAILLQKRCPIRSTRGRVGDRSSAFNLLAMLPVGPARVIFAVVFPANFTDALGVRPGSWGDGAM